jgi:hypothetical protein
MSIKFKDMPNEKLIELVGEGIGSPNSTSASMELQRRLNISLCQSITTLDTHIQKQSKVTTNLTLAMCFLSVVAVLLAIVQVVV